MKPLPILLTALALATRLLALDAAELAAVTAKFANTTPDEQYVARIELNRLIDTATIPGKGDPTAVTKTVVAALEAGSSPVEAKKYLLRALARVGTADAVEAATKLLGGTDAMLREEARQVLESIPVPQGTVALEQALRAAKDKRVQLGLINSLAGTRDPGAVSALATLAADPDPELARAAIAALGRLGATAALKQALADPKLPAAAKTEVERASLLAAKDDGESVRQIYLGSTSAPVRLAAFLALEGPSRSQAETALSSALDADDEVLRQAALSFGLKTDSAVVRQRLARGMAAFSPAERLVVLANIDLVKPVSEAEGIALACAKSEDPNEQIAALRALGKLATEPAFNAVLQAIGAREPAVNRAAGNVLGAMAYPAADAGLLALIQGAPGPNKLLALKAAAYRWLPEINPLLIKTITGPDPDASKEAMKTLYYTATMDALRTLDAAAKSAADPKTAASLTSLNKRIADRLAPPAASKAVKRKK